MEGIILLLDRTQPLHVLTVHLLQRRIIQRIVGVRRRILQVLAVLDPGFDDGSAQASQVLYTYLSLSRELSFHATKTARWEDGAGTVGRVRGWSPVCEDVGLEWIKLEDEQGVLVFLAEVVTQGLHHKSKSVIREENRRRRSGTP
jgi:hypothetical protein